MRAIRGSGISLFLSVAFSGACLPSEQKSEDVGKSQLLQPVLPPPSILCRLPARLRVLACMAVIVMLVIFFNYFP